ncbi:DNA/RNA nuclease SfsA [Prochlorococcus sp. MIT 1307]|uniref:DNA/RNA nuclease SfsA n=1 Tax=Prochlorococcus sp. MIT 1307 TaxID=3096219 RepID=UPI002A751D5D|nr:DNA/RNA nuclease SfsA [Prochlorococcus sp. MIT 1307]
MVVKPLLTFPSLEEGILLKRYKRFLADVELKGGQIVTAHCANTGPMKGILHPGGRIRVRYSPSPSRKLDWSWEQAEVPDEEGGSCWVGVNTSLPNKLVRLVIESGYLIEELGQVSEIRQEVPYGFERRSRIDLFIKPKAESADLRPIYLEVKNTTWKEGKIARFPDTVTVRGQKHLKELIGVLPEARSVLVPCLSRNDVDFFAPGDSADPTYGKLFRMAVLEGVEVIPCCFGFHRDKITWEGKRPILKS